MNERMVNKYLKEQVSDGEESDENVPKIDEKRAAQMLGDVGGSHRGSGDKKNQLKQQTA